MSRQNAAGKAKPAAAPSHQAAHQPAHPVQPTPTDPLLKLEQFLPYRLNVLASLVSQAVSSIYAERYGIGIPEWRVLVTLGQFDVMTGKAIGIHSTMHKTKVSRAVANLEGRRLVARSANRQDMREAFLSLTPEGRALYEELAPIALDFARQLLAEIPPEDQRAFERTVSILIERFGAIAREAGGQDHVLDDTRLGR